MYSNRTVSVLGPVNYKVLITVTKSIVYIVSLHDWYIDDITVKQLLKLLA